MIAVSKHGKMVYSKGFGYADVENSVKATPHSVLRIASISKPISCTLAAKLFENGKLSLDRPVDTYFEDLPPLKWNNVECKVGLRQLTFIFII